MRRYYHIFISMIVLIFLFSCSGGGGGGSSSASSGSSLVSVTVGSSGQTASLKVGKGSLVARAKDYLRDLFKSSEATAAIPTSVYKITFYISGSGMTTITKDVPISGQTSITETFTVPNGGARYFVVSAFSSSGDVLYRGEATSDLTGGDLSLSISMKTGNAAFDDWLLKLKDVLNKKPNMTTADIDPFYSLNYGIGDGRDRAKEIADWVSPTEGPPSNKKITSFSGVNLLPLGSNLYQPQGIIFWDDGSYIYMERVDGFPMITYEDSMFKFKGNGYWSQARIIAESHRWDSLLASWYIAWGLASPPGYATGLRINIEDNANHGLQYASVTGPGLGAGVTLTKQAGKEWFSLDTPATGIPTDQSELVTMNDTTIGGIPLNAAYTVTIMDAASTVVETRVVRLPQRPFTLSELSGPGYFMNLTLINGHTPTAADNALSAMNIGGTLTFSYSQPTAFVPIWLEAELNYFDGTGNDANKWVDLLLTQSSGSISTTAPAWTPVKGHLELVSEDPSNRKVYHHWMFQ